MNEEGPQPNIVVVKFWTSAVRFQLIIEFGCSR